MLQQTMLSRIGTPPFDDDHLRISGTGTGIGYTTRKEEGFLDVDFLLGV